MTAARPAVSETPQEPSELAGARCIHCAQPLVGEAFAPSCCRGCRAVHALLSKAGLTRYYDLRRGP
ncbi:MAG: heavy metal translocating P-type ATPase metal-binding domain-containing protein, partial [Deltaproteobacteria bacterium]|nr:heavy metal translocating P-type ATPase metal-binding domain-containing protein [Deltaproteobacteria bacterium]